MRRKKERSKQGQTNKQTRQSNTAHPRQSLSLEKNELPQVGLEPTTLYTLDRALYQLSYRGSSAGWAQSPSTPDEHVQDVFIISGLSYQTHYLHVCIHVRGCTIYTVCMYMTLIIMWYQRVCNCRQYCFDLVRSHQCSTAYTPLVPRVYIFEITQCSTLYTAPVVAGSSYTTVIPHQGDTLPSSTPNAQFSTSK